MQRNGRSAAFSREGKILRSALALIAFLGAGGTLGWMLLMPGVLRTEIESRTGFPVIAKSWACNPFGVTLDGKDVRVENPTRFGEDDPMLDIESLHAKASLPSLGRGEFWIYDLELKIRRATLVLDEAGRLNLDAFANRLFAAADGEGQTPFFVERLRLVVDELEIVDNSRVVPARRTVRALLDVEYADLENPSQVFAPIREVARSIGSLPES